MNKQNNSQKKHIATKKMVGLVLCLMVIMGVGYWMVVTALDNTRNYAEKVIAPLEQELTNAGANKKFGGGDDGKGPDNKQPYYDVGYETPGDKEKTIDLVKQIATSKGFTLTHASANNRGYLDAVDDEYIDAWYFDDTKPSPYTDLQPGNIQLGFQIGDKERRIAPGYTYVRINVQLPERK